MLILLGSDATVQAQDYVLSDFVVEGNKRTKEWLIIRESGFQEGMLIPAEDLNSSLEDIRQNISNLQLFLRVTVTPLILPDDQLLVLVEVVERWYLYPVPFVRLAEPNFNTWLKNFKESRTNYGIKFKQYNFRGRDERLELTVQTGYTRELGLRYISPYFIPSENWGLQILGNYKEYGEVTIGTLDNKRDFYEGSSPDTRKEQRYALGASYRPNILNENVFSLSYQNTQISDSLRVQPGMQLYDDGLRMRYFGIRYSFDRQNVDRKTYPMAGDGLEFTAEQQGLGIMSDAPSVFTTSATWRHYQPLPGHFSFQNLLKGQAMFFKELPYVLQDGLGYGNNSVRSYEYFILDSQYYILNRNNLKYTLIPDRGLALPDLPGLPLSESRVSVHGNFILDFGYAGDRLYESENPLNNSLLIGTGLGLDVVTNYDVVLRMEYTVNRDGQSGFFLHYRKSI